MRSPEAKLRNPEQEPQKHAERAPEAVSRRTDRHGADPACDSDHARQPVADRLPVDRRVLGRPPGRGGGGGGIGQLSGHLPGDRAGRRPRHRGRHAVGPVHGRRPPGHGQSRRGADHADGRHHLGRSGRGGLCAGALPARTVGRRARRLSRRARLHARLLHRHHLRLPLRHVPGADARRRRNPNAAHDRARHGAVEFRARSAVHLRLRAAAAAGRDGRRAGDAGDAGARRRARHCHLPARPPRHPVVVARLPARSGLHQARVLPGLAGLHRARDSGAWAVADVVSGGGLRHGDAGGLWRRNEHPAVRHHPGDGIVAWPRRRW